MKRTKDFYKYIRISAEEAANKIKEVVEKRVGMRCLQKSMSSQIVMTYPGWRPKVPIEIVRHLRGFLKDLVKRKIIAPHGPHRFQNIL